MGAPRAWHFWGALGVSAAVTALACWVGWTFLIQPMDAAVKTGGKLREACLRETGIAPRILANAGALFNQSSDAQEFTVLEKRETFSETIPGTGPLEATATLKVGFFAREKLEIQVHPGGRTATATFPPMRILDLAIESPALASLPPPARERAERLLRRAAKSKFGKPSTEAARVVFFEKLKNAGNSVGCSISAAE